MSFERAQIGDATIYTGGALAVLRTLTAESVQCCVTSPPYYGLRDYGRDGQIGLERTPDEYVDRLVEVFREVRRVLRDDGVLWLNLGDSYSNGGRKTRDPGQSKLHPAFTGEDNAVTTFRPDDGAKPKDLLGIPWRVAFALRDDGADAKAARVIERAANSIVEAYEGTEELPDRALAALESLRKEYEQAKGTSWYLRQDVIWSKPNPMPESVRDRCTKAHEYLFMMTKSARYFYDSDAIKEPGKNPEDDERRMRQAVADHKRAPDEKVSGIRERADKKRGHSRRHAGFNDRWDAMSKEEQGAGTRNKRSVWTVATRPYAEAHFATFPPALIEPCILAGSRPGDTVLDPFNGSGTSGDVALRLGRRYVGIELNPEYVDLTRRRLRGKPMALPFAMEIAA